MAAHTIRDAASWLGSLGAEPRLVQRETSLGFGVRRWLDGPTEPLR